MAEIDHDEAPGEPEFLTQGRPALRPGLGPHGVRRPVVAKEHRLLSEQGIARRRRSGKDAPRQRKVIPFVERSVLPRIVTGTRLRRIAVIDDIDERAAPEAPCHREERRAVGDDGVHALARCETGRRVPIREGHLPAAGHGDAIVTVGAADDHLKATCHQKGRLPRDVTVDSMSGTGDAEQQQHPWCAAGGAAPRRNETRRLSEVANSFQGQVRIVERILPDHRRMAPSHADRLACVATTNGAGGRDVPRERFVMIQQRFGDIEVAVPGGAGGAAKVDIVEVDAQQRVEATEFLEDRPSDRQAGPGDGADLARRIHSSCNPLRQIDEGVRADPVDAKHDAAVLHGLIRVEQPRTDRPGLGIGRMDGRACAASPAAERSYRCSGRREGRPLRLRYRHCRSWKS